MLRHSLLLPWLLASATATAPIARAVHRLSTGLAMEHLRCHVRCRRSSATAPQILLVHGTFHGAWCWERWMPRLAAAGFDVHAVSLRGTSGSPVDGGGPARISEHVDDLRCFVDEVLGPEGAPPPILVGHSFGGSSVLKYLEAGGAASGAAFFAAVPPSGNGGMTLRFMCRSPRRAWLITRGFALRTAASSAADARALFFDEQTRDEDLAAWLPKLAADSRVRLDLKHFNRNLPARAETDSQGRARWVAERGLPTLVCGAERDAVVDAEGVEEMGRFVGSTPLWLPTAHDVMLAAGWELGADALAEWARAACGGAAAYRGS